MIATTTIEFINRPNDDGTITESIRVDGCLFSQNGSPTGTRPELLIHLPRTFTEEVNGAWVNLEGHSYHVIGTTIQAKPMDANKPTPWNRYCIAERIY